MPSTLNAFFQPQSIAVVGATAAPNSVGQALLGNLKREFRGQLFAVNPKHSEVLGIRCYPSVAAIADPVDLAVIVIPAPLVAGAIRDCVQAQVKAAVIISAGFRETGAKGIAREAEVLREARKGALRIIGPNCLGLMSPRGHVNATFARRTARPGHLGFISQSGALCTAILDWSHRENVGFSAFVSVGSMLDVGWADLIQHLGSDPDTHSIVMYVESIPDMRAFLDAARAVALKKPIIAIKPGRSAAGARAAASHTGAMTGQDDVIDALFRACGVMRVDALADLFALAEALEKQPRPRGPRLAILTNAGGPAVLATDALLAGGGQLAELPPPTLAALNVFLPKHWSHQNPIDILGDASPERYAQAMEIAVKDPSADAVLAILSPQAMSDPAEVARRIVPLIQSSIHDLKKPVIASWMGASEVEDGRDILNRASVPTYDYPDDAARVFNAMWRYSANLDVLLDPPQPPDVTADRDAVRSLLASVRSEGRTLLTEYESKALLKMYGIPTVRTELAFSPDEAAAAANRIGYPVAVKLHSKTITHKTDVRGVHLHLRDENAVREAFARIAQSLEDLGHAKDFLGVSVQPMVRAEGYEIILGSTIVAGFGPVILFGSGGQLVEVYEDKSIGLPPLTARLARQLMERTRIHKALLGVRGRGPVDLQALERLLVQFSHLVHEQRAIQEVDINPLLVSENQIVALDARVVLSPGI